MRPRKQDLGRLGEEAAADYLAGLGHRVVFRNWRSGHSEVDIISLAEDGLHFVEVKTRLAPASLTPLTNITAAKARRMTTAANAFLHSEDRAGLPAELEVFLDVMSVLTDGSEFEIEYYPQAIVPLYL